MHTLLAAARDLAPRIAAEADGTERARRLPRELADDLAGAGLFRLLLPRDLDGFEADPATMIEVLETLGQADGATGWCVMIATTTSINAAWMPEARAREIWSHDRVITGGVFAPRGTAELTPDGYVVTGRWPWASGSANCDWLVGGALVKENGQTRLLPDGRPDARMMWAPRHEVELIDTWHVMGMRGTGSGDLAMQSVRVPLDRSVSLTADTPRIARPLYAFPVFGLLAMGIAAVALGNARGAVEDLVRLAGGKVPTGARRPLAEKPQTQQILAESEGRLRAARALLLDEAGRAWEAATQSGELGQPVRAGLRIAAGHATRTAAEVVRAMHDLAGGTSVYEGSGIERRFRDAHVATQHVMVGAGAMELSGRALLGVAGDFSQL